MSNSKLSALLIIFLSGTLLQTTIINLDATEEFDYVICNDLLFLDQAIRIATDRDDFSTFEHFFLDEERSEFGAVSRCQVSFQLTAGPPAFIMYVESYESSDYATTDFNLQLDEIKDDIQFEENIVGPNSIRYHLVDDPQTKYVKFLADISIVTFQTPYNGQEAVITVDQMVKLGELTKIRLVEKFSTEQEPINLAHPTCKGEINDDLLFIKTDKDNYERGDDIIVSGCVPNLYSKGLNIEILDPQGQLFEARSLVPELDGTFSVTIPIDEEFGEDGTYTAQAVYGDYTVSKTFVVPEFGSLALIVLAISIVSVIIFFKKSTLIKFSK